MARIVALVVFQTFAAVVPSICLAAPSTIREMVVAVQEAERTIPADKRNPAVAVELQRAIDVLTSAGVLDEEIETFFRRTEARDAQTLARRRQDRRVAGLSRAIDTVKEIINNNLADAKAITPEVRRTFTEWEDVERKSALQFNLETLRKLEVKYGPNSAKLNGLEVVLAYALQRTPGFGVGRDGPGRFEAVAAYAPTYISRSDKKVRIVGVAEIGLRQYIFKPGWGKQTGRWAWLKPSYTSYGVAWSGRSDDPMRPPWQGASRAGAFFGWGEMKVAWLAGDDQRILVTQQFQLIPWAF